MIAAGTVDERLQEALARKAEVLDTLLGGGQDVAVADEDMTVAPAEVIAEMARDLLRAEWRRRHAA